MSFQFTKAEKVAGNGNAGTGGGLTRQASLTGTSARVSGHTFEQQQSAGVGASVSDMVSASGPG